MEYKSSTRTQRDAIVSKSP